MGGNRRQRTPAVDAPALNNEVRAGGSGLHKNYAKNFAGLLPPLRPRDCQPPPPSSGAP